MLLSVLLVIGFGQPPKPDTAPFHEALPSPNTVTQITELQRQAFEKIVAFQFEYECETELQPEGQALIESRATKKFVSRFISLRSREGEFGQRFDLESENAAPNEPISSSFVLNGDFFARMNGDSDVVYREDIEDFENLPLSVTRGIGDIKEVDMLKFGFGTGDEYLWDAFGKHKSTTEWLVIPSSKPGLLLIERYAGSKRNLTQFTVDMGKGALIVEVKAYGQLDEPFVHRKIELTKIGHNHWFPQSVTEIRPGFWTRRIRVSHVQVNNLSQAVTFDLDMLTPQRRAPGKMLRKYLNGQVVEFTSVNGEWIPVDTKKGDKQ